MIINTFKLTGINYLWHNGLDRVSAAAQCTESDTPEITFRDRLALKPQFL